MPEATVYKPVTVPFKEKSDYPVPLRENGLLEEYLTGNHSHDIPEKTLNLEVAQMIAKLEAKPTFNPNLKFDPKKHIIFKDESFEGTTTATLKDLGINRTRTAPVSDFACAHPFPLISQEAVDMILWEALRPKVLKQFARLPNLSRNATRLDMHMGGHTKFEAPFSKDLYTSAEIARIVSKFTGVEASTIHNSSYGHMNISLATADPDELKEIPTEKKDLLAAYDIQNTKKGHEIPATLGLHYDSVTFALVIMLDLDPEAVGGETGIITGDDRVFRVPDPKVGYATLIQGMVLRHVATKPISNSNRITAVCGFMPCGRGMELDNCRLTSNKPSVLSRSSNNLYYSDWFDYRFENLQKHLQFQRDSIKEKFERGEQFDQLEMIKICKDMERYLYDGWKELEAVHNPPFPPEEYKTPYDQLPDYEY
ncbi:hypothetical protein CANARDRAFT_29871 [[Candida] arabinofermentans NRRL YB-2248]|uniref:Fe2OG dioxygenase domain-containing protein n=1 Tax=[Candida] arabinofermentans NRRL YB-2248 TaxID=983967 RepID=A0A1E4SVZ2_9ASCO|nr:hypothetical protein CANARDRAFT_29871 [[Candida] arabinofermentans NRRL YB-2248]